MKNKGFTLIELLGVIIILALLMIIVFPSIINSVKNSSNQTDDLTKELIYNATDLFIDEHINDFPKNNGSKYSIELSLLVDEGLLTGPIKLSGSDQDITNNKCIQVIYDKGYNYELKDSGTCEMFSKCNFEDVDKNDMYSKGDIISCNVANSIEKFYVMENENEDATPDEIDMLSMYNLYVNNSFDASTLLSKTLENPTGIQNELAKGFISSASIYYGTLGFSSIFLAPTVSGYPAYIYNENADIIYPYVNEYEKYLKQNGVTSIKTSLISKEQIEYLGCSLENENCTLAPNWVYSTSYWTGFAHDENHVWNVLSNGKLDYCVSNVDCGVGVRPVVTISITHIY